MSENKKELLIREFEDVLGNVDTVTGNSLYKNAKEHNPSIKPDSPVREKIESLPETKQDEFFVFLDEMLAANYYNKVMGAVFSNLSKMGVM